MSVLDLMASTGWAMLPERCQELAEIAERTAEKPSMEVLEAYRAKTADKGERLRVRNGIGLLYAEGPLMKKASFFTEVSGMTSYQTLRRDLQVLADDKDIHSGILYIDSPGGEASGCDELAEAIHEVNKTKKITAFVSGMAASGGYWLAAPCDRIVISDGALLGSIGVVVGIPDKKSIEERTGRRVIEFVSSQSPGKRPDPNTDTGRSQIQTMVDDLASVFVSAVAKYRGVSVEDVINKFGAGGLKVGKDAVAAGMADEVGQFEALVSSLTKAAEKRRSIPQRSFGGNLMSTENTGPTADEIAASATATTQARIKAIIGSDLGKELSTTANFLAFDTSISPEICAKILGAAKADFPKPAETPEPDAAAAADKLEADKRKAGTLGLNAPEKNGGDKKDYASSWAKATAEANALIGAV